MRIRLLAFASAGEALGRSELEISLPNGSRVADLRRYLDREHPEIRPLWSRLAIAVGGELASPETPLSEGAEVALLPPVSGGSPERSRLIGGTIDLGALVDAVRARAHGAVLVFVGTVRDHHRNREVSGLAYHAYRPMAEAALARLVAELESASPGVRVEIVHRLGEVPLAAASVAIAVASPHRDEAYAVSREALERLKREVPIWKRERYADGGAAWREEEPLGPPTLAGEAPLPAT